MARNDTWFGMPLGGDVWQRFMNNWFSPKIVINGSEAIEEKVVTEVASYGRQLGKLMEAVLLLEQAVQNNDRSVQLEELHSLKDKIDRTKQAEQARYQAEVEERLEQLQKADPKGFAATVKRFMARP